jgi:hypothetical protein
MKYSVKVLLTFVLLSVTMGSAKGNLWDMYQTLWPHNMGPTDTIYSLKTKFCFCGIDTSLVPTEYGQLMELYKLAHSDYNWKEAEKNSNKLNNEDYNDSYANNNLLGSSMWYSPFGGSWVSYKMPKKQMEAVIKGWKVIAEKGGVEIGEPSCKEYVSYFADNWVTYPTLKIPGKNDEEKKTNRDQFFDDHHVTKHDFVDPKSKKFKRSFPEDITAIKVSWTNKYKSLDFATYSGLEKANAIVCTTSAKREGDDEAVEGNLIFLDLKAGSQSFNIKGKALEYDDGITASQKLLELGSKFVRSKEKKVSNRAVLWKPDFENAGDADFVKENMLFPSTFMYKVCTLLLNPDNMGSIWGFKLSEVEDMYNYYSLHCPMMSSIGKMKKTITGQDGTKTTFETTGMFGKPDQNLFPAKPDGKPRLGVYYDIGIDAEAIQFEVDGDYTSELERLHNAKEEADNNREEKDKEQENDSHVSSESVEVELSEDDSLPDPKGKMNQNSSPHEDEGEGETENATDDDETDSSVHNENVVGNVDDLGKAIDDNDLTEICKRNIIMVEQAMQDQVFKTKKEALDAVYQMMMHPHDDMGCETVAQLLFEINYDKEVVDVVLRENGMPVLSFKVDVVDPMIYKPKEGDTKVVYQLIFWNHFFEDQQDALYYIPDRELVNEWDKYYTILETFKMFTESQKGQKMTLDNIFDDFEGYMESEVKEYGYKFLEHGSGNPDGDVYSSEEVVQSAFMYNENFKLRFFRLFRSDTGFYDFIFQTWKINEKYLMVKINGTRFTYSVLINVYTPEAKIRQIWDGVLHEFIDKFMSNGENGVTTMHMAKDLVYHIARNQALLYKYGWKEAVAAGDGDEEGEAGYVEAETSIPSENPNFYYSVLLTHIDEPIAIRGFIHLKENIPVINLFFASEKFEAEYIVPLSSHAEVQSYITNIFNEIYTHMYHLLIQIKVVEDEDITEEELDKNQKLGRYSMKKIILSMLKMLSKKQVYGCWKVLNLPASELNDDGTYDFDLDKEEEDHKDDSQKRIYKWTKVAKDISGELLILRSNYEWTTVNNSMCTTEELMNPVLIHLYPTWLDERNGYALTINSPSADGQKEIKTTYHFVKYQDYAHQKVLEHFIQNVFDQIFDAKGMAVKVED